MTSCPYSRGKPLRAGSTDLNCISAPNMARFYLVFQFLLPLWDLLSFEQCLACKLLPLNFPHGPFWYTLADIALCKARDRTDVK